MASLILQYDLSLTPASLEISLRITGGDVLITWGDTNSDIVTVPAGQSTVISHTYASSSTYTVDVSLNAGVSVESIALGGFSTNTDALISCTQLADYTPWIKFENCTNLTTMTSTLPSSITSFENMFDGTKFNSSSINNWNTSNVTNMQGVFRGATEFNQDLNNWDTSNVTNMVLAFDGATAFNGNISTWNTGNVTNMGAMFGGATAFNGNIGSWNVSNVTNMRSMFLGASSFNQDISGWNVGNVTDMARMFSDTPFNQNISGWNVSNVTDMTYMFIRASAFNQPIGSWNVSNVTNMGYMFYKSGAFNQDISDWNISNVLTMESMFQSATPLDTAYYDSMLIKWSALSVQSGVNFHAGSSKYTCDSDAETAHNLLTSTHSWVITDGGCAANPSHYYVNVNGDYVAFGDGSESSPYNKYQFNDKLKTSIVDGDVFNVKGAHNDTDTSFFMEALINSGSEITITIRGWDIGTNNPPVVMMSTTGSTSVFGNNGSNVNVIFQDLVAISLGTSFNLAESLNSTFTYKNVNIIANKISEGGGSANNRSLKFYGCTFNTSDFSITNSDRIDFYDCVFDTPQNVTISSINKLVLDNNLTNKADFTNNISNINDLSEYSVPAYSNAIISTPVISDFDTFVKYYTDRDLMYYNNFNISISDNPILESFRVANDYNNGLFDAERIAYGSYSFKGTSISDDENFSTSGHIGAFYFGGDYTNVNTSGYNCTIELSAANGVGVVDADFRVSAANISLRIPNVKAEGQKNFLIDFVAKEVKSNTYPEFCGLVDSKVPCNNCNTEDDVKLYNAQIVGGIPLVVDFSACATGVMEYSNYNPVKYKWWFDYENYNKDDDAVITTIPYVQHTYCGGYLEQYDVRLCVEFTGVE